MRYLMLPCLLVIAACGKQEPTANKHVSELARTSVPDALGKCVPAEAVALVRFAALDDLEPKLGRFMNAVEPSAADEANLNGLIAMAGTSPDQVDRSRPLAVAFTLANDGKPLPHFIVPKKDGGYTGFQGDSVPAIAKNLPGGDVAVRVDLERLVPQLRPLIDKALDPNQFMNNPELGTNEAFGQLVEPMMAWAKEVVYSGETLEVAVSLDGGKVDYNMAFTVLEGSALDTPPTPGPSMSELAKSFDAESRAMIMFLRADWSDALDFYMPFYESFLEGAPQAAKDAFTAYMPKMKEVYKLMGTTFMFGADFGGDGLRFDGVMQPTDPAAYVSRYKDLIQDGAAFTREMGITMDTKPAVEVDGVTLEVFTMDMDMGKLMKGSIPPGDLAQMEEFMRRFKSAMFGPEGMQVAQGVVGDRVVMTTAPYEPAVKVAKAGSGKLPAPIAAAMTDETSFFLHLDVHALLKGGVELFAKAMPENRVPKTPTGGPAHLWVRGSQFGRTYALGMHVDVGGIVAAGKSMD